jgi:hypothetical protein
VPPIDDAVVELLLAERAIRGLGTLRLALSHNERLRIGEMLRDCADAIDHGAGPMTLPTLQEPAPLRSRAADLESSSSEPSPESQTRDG